MTNPPENPWPTENRSGSLGLNAGAMPLFHAAWLFALGIALAHAVWLRPSWLLCALAPVAALWWLAMCRAERIAWTVMAALWMILGAWCGVMEPQPAQSPQLAAVSDGLLRDVEGTVVSANAVRDGSLMDADSEDDDSPSQRVDIEVTRIEQVNDSIDQMHTATGGVRLTVLWPEGSTPQTLLCGDHVRASVQLLRPVDFRDAGAWSRSSYLLDQGITSTAAVRASRIEKLPSPVSNSMTLARPWMGNQVLFGCWVHAIQQRVSARILALPEAMHGLPGYLRLSAQDAVMLTAMATGDRTYLSQQLRRGFEQTGSFHMLVVAGLHLAIVAGCLLWLARKAKVPRVPATLLTIAGSFAYALFTGFATPVERSWWMVTLFLLGRLIYRERSALNTIGFAALCLLVASPRVLFEAGFQMTLLAVVSIAGIALPLLEATLQPYLQAARDLPLVAIDGKLEPKIAEFRVVLRMLAERLERAFLKRAAWDLMPWVVRSALRCTELIVISCFVELAMSLPMALYFHRVTAFALPVNILIAPLLSLLLPVALMTLLVWLAWPAAAAFPAMATALLLHLGVGAVRLFDGFAWGDVRVAIPMTWQCAVFCVALALSLLLARGGRWSRRATWGTMLLAALAVLVPRQPEHPHNALLFEALDVGQGDSLLLITPDGKTMLVDAGGIGGYRGYSAQTFDVGEEVVSEALWSRGIHHLDVVALTHAHGDHMGGLPAVLRNFKPAELWVGNNPPVAEYRNVLNEAYALGMRVRRLHAGDEMPLGESAIRVLAPAPNYQPGSEPANDDSMVMRVAFQGTSILLAGDAERPEEETILREANLASTILKVGHHGSMTSTTHALLAAVHPQWAVISCGLHNRYGHPREEVLEELQAAGVKTFSTDIHGAVCFQLDGRNVRADALCGSNQ